MAVIISTLSSDGLAGTPQNGGARYVLMSTWENAQQSVHTLSDQSVLECYAFQCTDSVIVAGWSTDQTHNITIRNAAGVSTGSIGAGFRITSATGFNGTLAVRQNYTVLSGLEVTNTRTTDATAIAVSVCDYATIEKCIVRGGTTGANSNAISMSAQTVTNSFKITNTLIVRAGGSGITTGNYFYGEFSNITLDKCVTNGINCPGGVGSIAIKNCVSYGAATDFNLTTGGTRTNNASGDSSSGAITGITTDDFVDYVGGNYTPAALGKLDGAGADLSGTFTTDITGFIRSVPWEIGAYEIQGAAAPTIDFTGPDVETIENDIDSPLPDPTPDPSMDSRFTVVGGTATYTLQSGTLPAGVTIDPTTGNLVGTPTESGSFPNIVVRGTVS